MDEKRCKTCGETKALERFSLRRDSGRHRTDCKTCRVAHEKRRLQETDPDYNKRYYADHRDARAEEHKRWRRAHPDWQRRWAERNPGKAAEYSRRWRETHPERRRRARQAWSRTHRDAERAHGSVHYAITTGQLTRPKHCSECGKRCKPEAHHEDYSKPYEVDWLCFRCHKDLHASARKEATSA